MAACRLALTPTPLPQAGEGLHGSDRRTAFPRLRGKVPEERMGASRWPNAPVVLTLMVTTPCRVERRVGCAACAAGGVLARFWRMPTLCLDGCLPPCPHPNPTPAGGRGASRQRSADCLPPPAGEGARRADGGQPLAERASCSHLDGHNVLQGGAEASTARGATRGPQIFRRGTARRGAQSSGGWQESRTIRCGRTLAVGSWGALSGWISIAAAVRPVSRVWRRTEVSGGHSREASELSS